MATCGSCGGIVRAAGLDCLDGTALAGTAMWCMASVSSRCHNGSVTRGARTGRVGQSALSGAEQAHARAISLTRVEPADSGWKLSVRPAVTRATDEGGSTGITWDSGLCGGWGLNPVVQRELGKLHGQERTGDRMVRGCAHELHWLQTPARWLDGGRRPGSGEAVAFDEAAAEADPGGGQRELDRGRARTGRSRQRASEVKRHARLRLNTPRSGGTAWKGFRSKLSQDHAVLHQGLPRQPGGLWRGWSWRFAVKRSSTWWRELDRFGVARSRSGKGSAVGTRAAQRVLVLESVAEVGETRLSHRHGDARGNPWGTGRGGIARGDPPAFDEAGRARGERQGARWSLRPWTTNATPPARIARSGTNRRKALWSRGCSSS